MTTQAKVGIIAEKIVPTAEAHQYPCRIPGHMRKLLLMSPGPGVWLLDIGSLILIDFSKLAVVKGPQEFSFILFNEGGLRSIAGSPEGEEFPDIPIATFTKCEVPHHQASLLCKFIRLIIPKSEVVGLGPLERGR